MELDIDDEWLMVDVDDDDDDDDDDDEDGDDDDDDDDDDDFWWFMMITLDGRKDYATDRLQAQARRA